MKLLMLFKTSNMETVRLRQEYFGTALPSIQLSKRAQKFEKKFYDNFTYSIYYCDMTD